MTRPEVHRRSVLGIDVSVTDLSTAVERILLAAANREPFGVSALAVHGLMTGVKDPEFKYRLNRLEMLVPDGQPVRWALNLLHGTTLKDRVPGPDLMSGICRRVSEEGLSVFLFGSTSKTLSRLRAELQTRFPGLQVADAQPSRFRAATEPERREDIERIRASGAAITFVGLGCPRQEVWTYENRQALSTPVVAVGAAFDYHAGQLKRAPSWMGRAGLEWAYRLVQEPRRLVGRYLRLNPAFLTLLALEKAGWDAVSRRPAVKPAQTLRPS